MFIRSLSDVKDTDRYKVLPKSATHTARYLTAADGMGFSFHVNRGKVTPPTQLWYKNHWEANYLIAGVIKVTDMTSGQEWVLESGDLYQVGPNDRHLYEVLEDEHHLSIFCPSLRGDETHDEHGAYSASGLVPVTEERMFVRHIEQMREAGGEMLVANSQARSIRALTKSDELGFSFSDVRFAALLHTVAKLFFRSPILCPRQSESIWAKTKGIFNPSLDCSSLWARSAWLAA